MMPMGGSEARSEAMAELALHIHSLKTSPRLAEWLDSAEAKATELSIEQRANLREMRWHYAQAIAVPGTWCRPRRWRVIAVKTNGANSDITTIGKGFAPILKR